MTTVGSGKYTFEVNADWARIPDGWDAPMAAVAVDSQARVYGFNRGDHPIIVFDTPSPSTPRTTCGWWTETGARS